MPGYSYGKVLYSALQEYESIIRNNPVIIIGDFNLDKKVPSSYSGIKGYKTIIDLFNNYNLISCYHHFNNEEFGSETKETYYHYGKVDRPFHLDYCLVSNEVLPTIENFYIGEKEVYAPLSDHLPLVVEFEMSTTSCEAEIMNENRVIKKDITPEMLKQEYNLIIDNEIATAEEIEEAIRYIKANRIMKKI